MASGGGSPTLSLGRQRRRAASGWLQLTFLSDPFSLTGCLRKLNLISLNFGQTAARRRQPGDRRQADDQGGHQLNLRSFLPLALNNLASVYVDCGNLDLAAECYINAQLAACSRACNKPA